MIHSILENQPISNYKFQEEKLRYIHQNLREPGQTGVPAPGCSSSDPVPAKIPGMTTEDSPVTQMGVQAAWLQFWPNSDITAI